VIWQILAGIGGLGFLALGAFVGFLLWIASMKRWS
jgi:hypothetical protein